MAADDGKTGRRAATVLRQTKETRVEVDLDLDGSGNAAAKTGIGMLDHLVEQIGKHGLFDLKVTATGDLHVDEHHTVEDVGIAIGQAIDRALGDRAGIVRMADATVPLDEALASVAVDISGRPFCAVDVTWTLDRIGELPASLVEHLLGSIAAEAKLTLHARVLKGENDHHRAEAMCKALGRALSAATRIEPRLQGRIPSTKGTIG
ncbi:MAG: imidazoleglycerol-phosphate dehydratase HisB [Dehalococcoidia bacterium]|nr:MAG: imidazoleglycerol-phosphate dehydratase HisB [Dehalococcoidia bacterium]